MYIKKMPINYYNVRLRMPPPVLLYFMMFSIILTRNRDHTRHKEEK